jgi:hypothetical protein
MPPDDPLPPDEEVAATPPDELPLLLDEPVAPDDPPPESTAEASSESDPSPEFAHATHDPNARVAVATESGPYGRETNRAFIVLYVMVTAAP